MCVCVFGFFVIRASVLLYGPWKMGVLLMAEGIHPRVELNPVKLIPGNADRSSESNSNEEVVNGPSPPVSTRITEMIDVVESNDEPARWMPPPPKKKWIRHYLLGEIWCSKSSSAFRTWPKSDSWDTRVSNFISFHIGLLSSTSAFHFLAAEEQFFVRKWNLRIIFFNSFWRFRSGEFGKVSL